MFAHPAHAIHGFGERAAMQPELVAHGGSMSLADMLGVSRSEVPAQTIAVDTNAIIQHIAELGGAQLGAYTSTALEKTIGQLTAQELSWWIMESFEIPLMQRQTTKHLGCARYIGALDLIYDECDEKIDRAIYLMTARWYLLTGRQTAASVTKITSISATTVLTVGRDVPVSKSRLHRLQLARAGILSHPDGRTALQRSENGKSLTCDICQDKIFQNRYFGRILHPRKVLTLTKYSHSVPRM